MKGSRTKSTSTVVWTTRRLLSWTTDYLAKHRVDQARIASEMLLSHVLGVERLKLYMDLDRPASELEKTAFHELVERAGQHEPVDYLVGQTPFFSMMMRVSPAVLVPRPSTESVVEHVVQHARRTPGFSSPLIADVGTGSGAIAVALAKHIPNSRVLATDISSDALELARINAQKYKVSERIDLQKGDMLEPLAGQRVQYLVSNPPYISDDQWLQLPRHVKDYEPMGALRGGADGLRYIRRLIDQAPAYLATPGQLVLEIDATQKKAVMTMVHRSPGLVFGHILADHEGLPRVLVADVRS